jgi:mitochondrial fission protein ELM1
MVTARIICTDIAGLRSQALGLAEAAAMVPDMRTLEFIPPWDRVPVTLWPNIRWAVRENAYAPPLPAVVIGCGGAGARVAASLRGPGVKVVAIQDPRMSLRKFDLVLAARHDGITGENVIVTRTALHRVTQARLAAQREAWAPVFAPHKRRWGGGLGGATHARYRFEHAQGVALAEQLAVLMRRDKIGVVITPSRRTGPEVVKILRETLEPLGAWIWDGTGDNPYFGMLACADAILCTADSVSMASEAVATSAPVYLLRLPGKSTRIGAFMDGLVADGRVRDFAGKLELWDTQPLDDTPWAAAEMRRRLGL